MDPRVGKSTSILDTITEGNREGEVAEEGIPETEGLEENTGKEDFRGGQDTIHEVAEIIPPHG